MDYRSRLALLLITAVAPPESATLLETVCWRSGFQFTQPFLPLLFDKLDLRSFVTLSEDDVNDSGSDLEIHPAAKASDAADVQEQDSMTGSIGAQDMVSYLTQDDTDATNNSYAL